MNKNFSVTLCLFLLREVSLTFLRSIAGCLLFMRLSWAELEKKVVLHHLTEDVSDQDVGLLYARGTRRGNDEREFGMLCYHPSVIPGQSHGLDAHFLCHLKCLDHVGGIPAGTDADRHIPFLSQGPELFGKDLVK